MRLNLLLLLALVGCGRQTPFSPEETVPITPPAPYAPTGEKKIVLAVFSAPWCGPCKNALPRVQRELDALPASERQAIEFRMYVVTGASPGTSPTQAVADRYKSDLGIDAVAIPDVGMKKFRSIHTSTAVPAGAVLDSADVLMRRFPAGLDVEAIVDYAASSTQD